MIDDRTLKGPEDQVLAALLDVVKYDKAAGHETNPEEMTLSATTPKLGAEIAKWVDWQVQPSCRSRAKAGGGRGDNSRERRQRDHG